MALSYQEHQQLVRVIQQRIQSRDGAGLASFFSFPALYRQGKCHPPVSSDTILKSYPSIDCNLSGSFTDISTPSPFSNLPKPYDSMVFLTASLYGKQSGVSRAYFPIALKLYLHLMNVFLRHFSSLTDSNWELPILKTLAWCLYHLALKAPINSEDGSTREVQLEECARALSRCFTQTLTDRSPINVSKKWGSLFIVVLLFRIYFRLNHLRLCDTLLRALENPQLEFPPLNQFPKSEWISFAYYRARIHINHNELENACELLKEAFIHCRSSSKPNIQQLALYWITAKLMLGSIPTDLFLHRCDLYSTFHDLVLSIKKGNVLGYQQALQEHREFFVTHEIYLLLMTKLKFLTYRVLLGRMIRMAGPLWANFPASIPLSGIYQVFSKLTFNSQQPSLDLDELECILANLIYDGHIKGRLVHDQHMLQIQSLV
jgi:hypothetical protein